MSCERRQENGAPMMEQLITKPISCNESLLGDLVTNVALKEQETKDVLASGEKAGLSTIEEESSKCLKLLFWLSTSQTMSEQIVDQPTRYHPDWLRTSMTDVASSTPSHTQQSHRRRNTTAHFDTDLLSDPSSTTM